MKLIDFEGAKTYALQRLERELSPALAYHSLAHTRDEVVLAAKELAVMEGIQAESVVLLLTAACFHDIGFVVRPTDNEEAAVRIAAEVLPRFGYTRADIQLIGDLILATKMPQSPHTFLEMILADADLDILGQMNFLSRNQDLRNELASLSTRFTDEEWYCSQLEFMQTHRYFTPAAHARNDAQKEANLQALEELLEQCREKMSRETT